MAIKSWARGCGVIKHNAVTVRRIEALLKYLETRGLCTRQSALQLLSAADRLTNMGMWLVVHMTYVKNVRLDGTALHQADFKTDPEGHTGGALNMVPAYVGYLLANALTGNTRAWMMGQGHCVAAIDAVNVLLGNTDVEQARRYPLSEAGLNQLCGDFYGYQLSPEGRPAAPMGSHVNAYTAGGISEGGYLGFAELQYMHMPLPGQELVTFLSDGAFEEQRGSDWAARWWRGEDTGLVMPVMIANGRRIDQRSTLAQVGGVHWFRKHLKLNGFEPIDIDGRDPAAFAWAIIDMGERLSQQYQQQRKGTSSYPLRLPYAIAKTVKGYGFPGAGTNAAHNLPLQGSPALDEEARRRFNAGARKLHVPLPELTDAIALFNNHALQSRPQEKDHCLRNLSGPKPNLPPLPQLKPNEASSPMECIDGWFAQLVKNNAQLRFRVGNPDEMRSNRMNQSLDTLLHRVTAPEAGVAESLQGSVITALNEEAVVSAALANKQGLNLAVSYEAFAVKMLGVMRQEVIFARHLKESGRALSWVSVPIIATSHTWENGKNEQSHQDPTLSEAWLQEMADVAPVLFPFDAGTAVATLAKLYSETGRVATLVVPKGKVANQCDSEQARRAAAQGAWLLSHDSSAQIQMIAVGGYQLQAVQRAVQRLRERGVSCSVVALIEPGKFRVPRDKVEAAYVHTAAQLAALIPNCAKRMIVCHTHAEPMIGVLRRLDTGPGNTSILGYRNRGGTLDVFGMQFANGQSWAHLVAEAAELLGQAKVDSLLDQHEIAAITGQGTPEVLR